MLGADAATPADAASTCSHTFHSRTTAATAATSSIAPVDVEPAARCTISGRRPAAASSTIASRSASTSMVWVAGSTATVRTAPSPNPAIIAALTSEEWACVEP